MKQLIKKVLLGCCALLVSFWGIAQPNIAAVEYYVDVDPGYGLATSVSIVPGSNLVNQTININPASLTQGIHLVGVRARDANGAWGLNQKWVFIKPYTTGAVAGVLPNITQIEYFIDVDPGLGAATTVNITPGSDLANMVVNVDPTTLTQGIHLLGLRAKDANGAWGLSQKWVFIKPFTGDAAAGAVPNITKVEYFIDTDPGYGNGTAVSITPGTDLASQTIAVNPASLAEGIHLLGLRAQDANGSWSLGQRWLFVKPFSASVDPPAARNILQAEYYFDADPGFGKGFPIAIQNINDLNNIQLSANVTGLIAGSHKFYIRAKDNQHAWGRSDTLKFTIASPFATPSIEVASISKAASFCARDSFNVGYQATGTYQAGNIFTVEMSDGAGSFATPVTIGAVAATTSGLIACYLPAHTADGAGYKLRIKSSSTLVVGNASVQTLSIRDRPMAQVINGRVYVNGGYTWPYTVAATAGSQWKWSSMGGSITTGQNSNAINILWSQPAATNITGNIYTIETNQFGCVGDTSRVPVTIYRLGISDSVAMTACKGEPIQVYIKSTGAFDAGNTVIAELSDVNGGFANPSSSASIGANGNVVAKADTILLTIPTGIANGNQYRVRVRSSVPNFTGDTSLAISIQKPDMGVDQSVSYCVGRGYNLQQIFTNPLLTYTFFTNNFTTVARPDSVEAGTYIIKGVNMQGCSDTATVVLSSNPTPNLGPDTILYHACPGETSNIGQLYVTTGLSAVWSTGNTAAAPPGNYRLIVTNNFGCTDTAFATVLLETAVWTGTISSDWHTANNWSIQKVPTANTHVIVPGSTPNPCIISTANAQAASVQVRNGGTVKTNTGLSLDIKGNCMTLPTN